MDMAGKDLPEKGLAGKKQADNRLGRLTRSRDYEALRRGKRVQAGFGRLQGIARTGADVASGLRFGLIVPKKLGNAPRRNRIKRLLREGMRSAGFDREQAAPGIGVDIGIFPAASVLDMTFEALASELRKSVEALVRKLARLPI
jgi:ribonuclease P protein component